MGFDEKHLIIRQEVGPGRTSFPMFEEFDGGAGQRGRHRSHREDLLYDEPAAARVYTTPVAVRARVKPKRTPHLPGRGDRDDGRVTIRTDELQERVSPSPGEHRVRGERFVMVQKEARAEVGDAFLLTRVMVKKETG